MAMILIVVKLWYNNGMIILMGLAGSGKSTQGQILAQRLGRVWLSAGQVLRETADPEVAKILESGQLVPDSLTIPLMRQSMAENLAAGRDLILDGYPRDPEQAEWMAENAADRIELILYLEVPKEELMQRMKLRGRADDTDEAIVKRFQIVEQNIREICQIFRERGIKIVQVDGFGAPEEVTARIWATVERELAGKI